MTKEIIFATNNNFKKERFEAYFAPLGLSIKTFLDLGRKIEVLEDGKTAEENAVKKAIAGFKETGLPSFGVDYWFYIVGLPEKLQPGPFVRRIFVEDSGERYEATDEEMLNYYEKIIESVGGQTKGIWTSSIALVVKYEKIFTESFRRETILTSKRSSKITPGEPLNSLQIDPNTGKYFTDLTHKEWVELEPKSEKRYIDFMRSHLGDI